MIRFFWPFKKKAAPDQRQLSLFEYTTGLLLCLFTLFHLPLNKVVGNGGSIEQ